MADTPGVPVPDPSSQIKSGLKSSELWVTLIGVVIQCVNGLPAGTKLVSAVIVVVYAVLRTIVKTIG